MEGTPKVSSDRSIYKIGGCDVCFPHSAYGTQLSFMGKVISALESKHNALLEAPTGSGKTLSLLCSSIAWQEKEKRRVASFEGITEFGEGVKEATARHLEGDAAVGSHEKVQGEGGFLHLGDKAAADVVKEVKMKAPKIYYATRTHSQIAQVVAELKRSGYKPKMAILGSKQQYCVNAHVRSKGSVDEGCEDVLKDGNCQYFKGTQSCLVAAGKHLHDIEDLCNFGKRRKACPYFLSRHMAGDADVVFGPYNYLLDPVIRRSMGIDLEDSVVIFDEAHNIEDVCRDAGSMEINLDTVNDMIGSLARACKYNMKPEAYDPLHNLVCSIKNWMMKEDGILKAAGRGAQEKIWMGTQLIQHLTVMGLGPDRIEHLWDSYQKAREHDEEMIAEDRARRSAPQPTTGEQASSQNRPARIGAITLGTISRIIQMFRILHFECKDGGRDYRLVLARTANQDRGMPRRHTRKDVPAVTINVTLSLWCLNPGVIFHQIASKAHSVVLTSGTLAPLDSFSSELTSTFEVCLEAPHVVNMKKQVFAGIIPTTPQGSPLLATYQHSSKTAFQDSIGMIVLSMCRVVPDGLLVFFPSYAMLDKLVSRWSETGIMEEIEQLKPCVQEPRSGGAEALKNTMDEYYAGISGGKGGIFFAVCRGKVSEGLDFADSNARAVIVIGIPFPNLKDSKVEAKKRYNDSSANSLGLLSGAAWYEQQAFRALNQALGRCIRHKNDWGAILLVDERFKNPKFQGSLSRWIRSNLCVYPSFGQILLSLEDFFITLKRSDEQAKPSGAVTLPPAAPTGTGPKKDALAILMAGHRTSNKTLAQLSPSDGSPCLPAQRYLTCDDDSCPLSDPEQIELALQEAPIETWVDMDVTDWCTCARKKHVDLDHEQGMRAAIPGIRDAFSFTIDYRDDEENRFKWMESLAVGLPRGIQAIYPEIASRLKTFDESAVSFAEENTWKKYDQQALLLEMKKKYDVILGRLLSPASENVSSEFGNRQNIVGVKRPSRTASSDANGPGNNCKHPSFEHIGGSFSVTKPVTSAFNLSEEMEDLMQCAASWSSDGSEF